MSAIAALRCEEGWLAYCVGATGTLKVYALATGLQVRRLFAQIFLVTVDDVLCVV